MRKRRPKPEPPELPSLLTDAQASKAVRNVWTMLAAAGSKCVEESRGTDSVGERNELAVVANALAAMASVIARGDADALRKLQAWTKAAASRESLPAPVVAEGMNAWHFEDRARRGLVPAAGELALAIRERLRSAADTRARLGLEGPKGSIAMFAARGELDGILMDDSDPAGRAVRFEQTGAGPPAITVALATRANVALILARELKPLFPPAEPPQEMALARAIYKRMPLPDTRATDRSGRHRFDTFKWDASDPERTIVAAFKAAGFPADKADRLFNREAVETSRAKLRDR